LRKSPSSLKIHQRVGLGENGGVVGGARVAMAMAMLAMLVVIVLLVLWAPLVVVWLRRRKASG
jgi:hypothetical protein